MQDSFIQSDDSIFSKSQYLKVNIGPFKISVLSKVREQEDRYESRIY